MDNLRGQFPEHGGPDGYQADDDAFEDEIGREPPPAAIGQDERRMQVRAYNFWASLLENRNLPAIDQLDPENLADFGPYSVLLDFSKGIENPAIIYLGEKLAEECDTDRPPRRLSDVPSRSLLSRITDHYLQILANQAPIGFEAEFVNQRGATILYRGILLPFSGKGDTIDFIYGVINWKELADQKTADELLLEIDQALDAAPTVSRPDTPLTKWADGPMDLSDRLDCNEPVGPGETAGAYPEPLFGLDWRLGPNEEAGHQPPSSPETGEMGLADWLACARELAQLARSSEDRSRRALYAAISRAWDFALAAAQAPEEFAEMVADAGLSIQQRAPMTPIVKLVFGADYDKTRLAEYATVLCHAKREGLRRGELAAYLAAVSYTH
ncbi:MAG: hypothetical protein N2423_06190, partial [Novosphingobium sp.]|nr:hypothetical protein [Novosphingobium sp.]